MVYASRLVLPSDKAEIGFVTGERRTCFNTFYPFNIFPLKELRTVEFEPITIFYGGNGSGKSTLINVMADKMNAERYSEFNSSPFFGEFVKMAYIEYMHKPEKSCVLTSDDVFEYVLNARYVNEKNGEKRDALFQKYVEVHREAEKNPGINNLNGLADYERWREVRDILSPKKSKSGYIRDRVAKDVDLRSNGETAMRYFVDMISDDGVYFLDEPENSLSIEYQIELADYIAATARVTDSQFVIATHSPIFLAMERAKIYNLDACPVRVCPWTELPNVRRYYDFFMKHKDEFN